MANKTIVVLVICIFLFTTGHALESKTSTLETNKGNHANVDELGKLAGEKLQRNPCFLKAIRSGVGKMKFASRKACSRVVKKVVNIQKLSWVAILATQDSVLALENNVGQTVMMKDKMN